MEEKEGTDSKVQPGCTKHIGSSAIWKPPILHKFHAGDATVKRIYRECVTYCGPDVPLVPAGSSSLKSVLGNNRHVWF